MSAERQRRARFADRGRTVGADEVDHRPRLRSSLSIGIDQRRRALVDGDGARFGSLPGSSMRARKTSVRPMRSRAWKWESVMVLRSGEMRRKSLPTVTCSSKGSASACFGGDGVLLGGEDVLAEHCQARARAADGDAAIDQELDGLADRRPAPQPHVVPLVAAGDEERLGVRGSSRARNWIAGGLGGVQHNALDRIDLAEILQIGVIPVGAGRAHDHDVATARTFEEPAHDRVLVLAAADEGEAGLAPASGRRRDSR